MNRENAGGVHGRGGREETMESIGEFSLWSPTLSNEEGKKQGKSIYIYTRTLARTLPEMYKCAHKYALELSRSSTHIKFTPPHIHRYQV